MNSEQTTNQIIKYLRRNPFTFSHWDRFWHRVFNKFMSFFNLLVTIWNLVVFIAFDFISHLLEYSNFFSSRSISFGHY